MGRRAPALNGRTDRPRAPEPLSAPVRLTIQQPALPAYRVALFARIAALEGIELELVHGSEEPALANASAVGFTARLVDFRRVDLPGVGPLFWHAAQWRGAGRRRTDVLVLSWNSRFVSLWAALVRARLTGVPVAVWGHGYSKASTSRVRAFVRLLPARLARAAILYDGRTAERLVRDGLDRARVHVAPNGLDGEAIGRSRERVLDEPETARRAWRERRLPGTAATLLHVGRVDPASRLDLAVDALALLEPAHPGVRLAIVGRGEDELEALRARAAALGLADRLICPGPVYDEDEVTRWMMAADAFVYPVNAGLSLIHAFNHALPTVVAAPLSAHNPEIAALVHGVNGVVAEATTAEALARALGRALGPEGPALGRAALRTARDEYDVSAMVATFSRVVRKLAGQDRRENG